MADIILSVPGNALGVTEGKDGIEGKYASVVEQEDAITGLRVMRTQCSKGRWGCYWMMELKGKLR